MANTPISSLPAASGLGGDELVPIVQGGTTVRTTTAEIAGLAQTGAVTSVGLSLPGDFTVTGSPVTSSGTLTATWGLNPTGTGAMVRATSPVLVTPVLNGTPTGTGVATAATASTLALRDASGNLTNNNEIRGYTTTATAAGTTTLTVGSTYYQFFTGTNTQTIVLPVTSTLSLGQAFSISNLSTNYLTVNSSGGNLVLTVPPGAVGTVVCILTSGTTAASWSAIYQMAGGRQVLSAARTYYVGAPIPTPTISIASPAVVSSTAHGLSAGDPVVFSVPAKMRTATVTIASPGVVTLNSHGFAAGQPIVFSTTGALPTGITAGTTYYVISTGLTSNSFQFSTSVGGSAVNTSGSQSGTHYISAAGSLPTGITEGTVYYVSTAGLTTNAFQVADTQAHALAGTNSINTSGSITGTPIYCGYTGNDSNYGLSQTRSGAFLTVQKAWNTVCALDLGTFTATIQLANGTYTAGVASSLSPIGGNVTIQGDVATPSNVFFSTGAQNCFVFSGAVISAGVTLAGMKISASRCVWLAAPGVVQYHDIQFDVASFYHLQAQGPGAAISASAAAGAGNIISGGAGQSHVFAVENAKVAPEFVPITILGLPAFTAFAAADRLGIIMARSMTFTGAATGARYAATANGVVYSGGGGASYFPGNSPGSTATGGQYV